jgi:hypothetical protein
MVGWMQRLSASGDCERYTETDNTPVKVAKILSSKMICFVVAFGEVIGDRKDR